MTWSFAFHVRTLGNRTRNHLIRFDAKRGQWGPGLAKWNVWRETQWLNALHVVGPAQLDCRWSDVIIHTCCQFLPACCTAQLQFQCTYTCSFPYLLILWSSIASTVKALGRALSRPPFLFHSSALWEKNSCTNNRCVLWSQATTSIFKEWYVPNPPWHNLTKETSLKEHWWSFVQLWIIRSLPCVSVLMETPHPELLSDVGVLTLLKAAVIGSCQWPFPLWHGGTVVCHTGSATVDFLRRRSIAWFLLKFRHCTETGLGEAEVCPMALFPGKCPPGWMRTLRKLCLSSLNNLSLIAGLR